MSTAPELPASAARRLAIGAAGLAARRPRTVRADDVRAVLRHLGALQLDTISTLARAHELVPAARLGTCSRALIDAALWGANDAMSPPEPVQTVEYWSHAACVLPVEMWPFYAFRRREYVRRGRRWHELTDSAIDRVRAHLNEGGPVTTGDLGGAKTSSAWWAWSDSKIAIEWLLDIGEVVCVRRTGWRRVYDLADRALPASVRLGAANWVDDEGVYGPSDNDCHDALIEMAALTHGVATIADLADVPRLGITNATRAVRRLVERAILEPVDVQGWGAVAYMHRQPRTEGTRRRAVMLSPFDPLVWERDRTERLFGMHYRIESYTPAAKRERGYYAMPILAGDRLIGTVDPARTNKGNVLTARTVVLENPTSRTALDRDARAVATALAEAATWVGASALAVETVRPAAAAAAVRQSVAVASSRMSP